MECTTMNNVLARAMEAELGALFVNFQRGDTLRIFLEGIGHQQPPTLVVTDSATINGFVSNNIRKIKSIAIYMRLYWVHNRVRQGHYIAYSDRGKNNLDD